MEIVHHHFATIDSTNTWGKEHAHTFAKDKMTLVTADGQTAGRGRFRRNWDSPPGQNIYASYCFFVEKHWNEMGNIPQILAISAAEVLINLGFKPELKWPNDVLLQGKKVAGILCETTPLSDQLAMILGIGLNVNMPSDLLDKIDRPAISLLVDSGKEFPVKDVLDQLTARFLNDLDRFFDQGFYGFYHRYVELMNLKKAIRFSDSRAIWEGTIESIGVDGSLNMRLKDGTVRKFVSGEILF